MLRCTLVTFLLVATPLLADLAGPLDLRMDVKEPEGYSRAVEVTVTASINNVSEYPVILESDVEIKIFIPPAMKLLEGDLNWKGQITIEKDKTINLAIIPDLDKTEIYQIGAVLNSDAWGLPIVVNKSIYLENNRGIVLGKELSVIEQMEKDTELKKFLGYRVHKQTDENAKEIKTVSIRGLDIPSEEELGNRTLQDFFPNQLYNEEWLDINRQLLTPLVIKDNSSKVQKKKANDVTAKLATPGC